jgi:hypothetical protein
MPVPKDARRGTNYNVQPSLPAKEYKPWQFKPGNTLGGRPVGARNKYGEQFFKDFLADWEQHGPQVIAKMRNERPDLYLKVAAGIVPKELHISTQGVADMSDEEVLRIIDAVRALVAEQGLPQIELQAQSPAPRSGGSGVVSC